MIGCPRVLADPRHSHETFVPLPLSNYLQMTVILMIRIPILGIRRCCRR